MRIINNNSRHHHTERYERICKQVQVSTSHVYILVFFPEEEEGRDRINKDADECYDGNAFLKKCFVSRRDFTICGNIGKYRVA